MNSILRKNPMPRKNHKTGSMLDRKKVLIDQGLYRGQDAELKAGSSNATTKTDKPQSESVP
jgi:hypothetical protein